MENSKLPFRYWYMAMHLMTSAKKSFSALEFQRQIGHKRYEPIWAMLHKIRMIMGQSDGEDQLRGWVELDKGFLNVRGGKKSKLLKENQPRGKRKAIIAIMAESEPAPASKRFNKRKRCKRFGMRVLPNMYTETLIEKASEVIRQDSSIQTSKFPGYAAFKNHFYNHEPIRMSRKETPAMLPWVYTALQNVRRTLMGIYHTVSDKHLQKYLDEFCYKLNRRYLGEEKFENLVLDSLRHWNPEYQWQRSG